MGVAARVVLGMGLVVLGACSSQTQPPEAAGGNTGTGGASDVAEDGGPALDGVADDASACDLSSHALTPTAPCVFTFDEPAPDSYNVRVIAVPPPPGHALYPVPQGAPDGWTYGDDSRTIVLQGASCQSAVDGTMVPSYIIFGCVSHPIP